MFVRNRFYLILLAMFALLLLAAPALAQEPVEIVLPLLGFATELEGWTATVDAANQLLAPQNIHITIQSVPVTDWNEYYQRSVAQIAAGQPIDIGRLAESHLPTAIRDGVVVDLTDQIASDLNMDEYFGAAFENAGFVDGRYYGIPSGIYYMLMYYNKNLFDAAGLEYPSADWENAITFDQVRETAAALSSGEGANRTFGFSGGPYMAFIGMYSASGGGPNVFNEDGTCGLETPEALAVYKWFEGMLNEDFSQPRPTDTAVMTAYDMFVSGRIAMLVDGTWFQTGMRDIEGFDVGIAAAPSASGQAVSASFVDSWVMWEGTQHPKEAWLALQALASVEASTALAERGVGGIPIRRDVLDALQDEMIGPNFDDASRSALIQGLDHIQGVPYNEFYNEADVEINAVLDEWLLGNVTAEEFAAQSCEILNGLAGQ
jgi:ABC-type glycerol-3-phosphate transport system substrate-binding protein